MDQFLESQKSVKTHTRRNNLNKLTFTYIKNKNSGYNCNL